MKTCSISGCSKTQHSRGWCAMHYWRWRRSGDPLISNQADRNNRELSLKEIQDQTGATYRQLDYWSRQSYLPFGEPGSGRDRSWSQADLDWIRYLVEASRLSLPQVAALIRDSEQLVEKSA